MKDDYSLPQGDPGNVRHSGEEKQESIYPNHHDTNITDGSEFLDDGVRTKDQPYDETEIDDPLEDVYE